MYDIFYIAKEKDAAFLDLQKRIPLLKLAKYEDNLGEILDEQFGFTFDATKNPEKQLAPHVFPEIGIEQKEKPEPKKKKIKI